jgi:primase-polymerase (primpol)-like protein
MNKCEVCGGQVASPARGRRPRFCSGRCRVAAHRARHGLPIPAELRDRDRWVRHLYKRPMSVSGRWVSVTDPYGWASFDSASAATVGDGVGFVLNGDGVVCIDLDDCVVDGVPNEKARALIESLPRTFVEFSPSGRGLHVWGFGEISGGRKFERDGLKIEVYGDARYLTVTGNVLVKARFARLDVASLLT